MKSHVIAFITTELNSVPVPGRRDRLPLVVGFVAVSAHVGGLQLCVALDPRLAALRDGVDGGDAGGALGPLVRHGAVHHGAGHTGLALLVAESSGASEKLHILLSLGNTG